MLKAPKFRPTRDRKVDVTAVSCPSCGATPRSACFRLDGLQSPGHLQHPSRRRMAVRADNIARGL